MNPSRVRNVPLAMHIHDSVMEELHDRGRGAHPKLANRTLGESGEIDVLEGCQS
jgi:hypothetical protein